MGVEKRLHETAHMWKPGDNFEKLNLSFHLGFWDSGILGSDLRLAGLYSKLLYPLSHLPAQKAWFSLKRNFTVV